MRTSQWFPSLALLFATATTSLAAVGPNYVRPTNNVPAAFKDADAGAWQEAKPADAVSRGEWWTVFNDPILNDLESRATLNNQDLKAALARVEQAHASSRQARADFFPGLNLDAAYNRTHYSPNAGVVFPVETVHNIRVPFDLNYELDIWGRVRRVFESAKYDTEARKAAFHSLLLAIHAEVAQNYFALQATEVEWATIRRTAELRNEALRLAESRFRGGSASELELAQAQREAAAVAADSAALERRRSDLRNILAVLVGTSASDFVLSDRPIPTQIVPPSIPPGLPGELLERRPDIAEAERDLASRNARIGVAKAAFFPTVRLTGIAGWESADVDTLFNWQSRIWSIGPSITLPIFQGGRNRANLRRAQAVWDEGVANYRQKVLIAFREVQDSLTALRFLAEEAAAQTRVVTAAQRTAQLSRTRYEAGFVGYLEVIDSERSTLESERRSAQLAGQRLVTTVQLIKAIGGGWTIPTDGKTAGTKPFGKNEG